MLLAISSSSAPSCGCCLIQNNQVIDHIAFNGENSLTQIPLQINALLKRNAVYISNKQSWAQQNTTQKKQLQSIVIDTGPGSFTGIRFAASYAAGLTAFTNIKLGGLQGFSIMSLNIAHLIATNGLNELEGSNQAKTPNLFTAITNEQAKQGAQQIESQTTNIRQTLLGSVLLIPRSNRSVYAKTMQAATNPTGSQNSNPRAKQAAQSWQHWQHTYQSIPPEDPQQNPLQNAFDQQQIQTTFFSEEKILKTQTPLQAAILSSTKKVQVPINIFTMARAIQILQHTKAHHLINEGLIENGITYRTKGKPITPFYLGNPNGTTHNTNQASAPQTKQ